MKTLYILTIEETTIDFETQNPKGTLREVFCYANDEEDAISAWEEEQRKRVEESIRESYGMYKTDHQTWCTHSDKIGTGYYDYAGFYVEDYDYKPCNFQDTTGVHKRKKKCPRCGNKTLNHINAIKKSILLRKQLLDSKKVIKVRVWRPRKSQILGIYKWKIAK